MKMTIGGNHKGASRNRKIDQQVGQRIKLQRQARHLSQIALAEKMRVSFQQVQKYESGINALPCTRVPELCKALGFTPNDLFGV